MKLISITVEKYRSITRAHRVPISDMTVLVGPNNEGKSNILRALVAAMNVLTRGTTRHAHGPFTAGQRGRMPAGARIYDWDTDFPMHLQEKHPAGQSIIHLDFRLNDEELQEFRAQVGSRLKDNLRIRPESRGN